MDGAGRPIKRRQETVTGAFYDVSSEPVDFRVHKHIVTI
jgi:hypothetical protein